MPIVESPKPDAPLSQGDILTGIRFFATEGCWKDKGGDSVKAPYNLCMVLSRPCVAAHKKTFVVAAVEQLKDALPGTNTFDKLLSLMTGLRDGRTSPDVFYLGQLPGRSGRYAARFDSIHTIATPQKPEDMKALLERCRIASLHIDFCRDLHVRVFNAFASLGFDDHDWPSTEDLQALVDQGTAELSALETELAKTKAAQSAYAAEGKTFPDKQIISGTESCEKLRATLKPYQDALAKRKKS